MGRHPGNERGADVRIPIAGQSSNSPAIGICMPAHRHARRAGSNALFPVAGLLASADVIGRHMRDGLMCAAGVRKRFDSYSGTIEAMGVPKRFDSCCGIIARIIVSVKTSNWVYGVGIVGVVGVFIVFNGFYNWLKQSKFIKWL